MFCLFVLLQCAEYVERSTCDALRCADVECVAVLDGGRFGEHLAAEHGFATAPSVASIAAAAAAATATESILAGFFFEKQTIIQK